MVAIQIDETRFPLMLVTFSGPATDEEFDAYLARIDTLMLRKQRTATVIDARRAAVTTPLQRRKQADWMKRQETALRRYSCGTAFVIDSALVRGVLTAIFWVQPLPHAHLLTPSFDEAIRWAQAQLEAGATLSERPAR